MAYNNQELINLLTKVLAGGVLDSDPTIQWYEARLPASQMVDGGQVWSDLAVLRGYPAANVAAAQAHAAGAAGGLIQDISAPASAIRLTKVSGLNNTYAAYSVYGDPNSALLRNWIRPQQVPQVSGIPSAGYSIRLYEGDPNAGGTEILTTDGTTGTGENKKVGWIWYYDMGVLCLADDFASSVTDPYVLGFRYIGALPAPSTPFLVGKTAAFPYQDVPTAYAAAGAEAARSGRTQTVLLSSPGTYTIGTMAGQTGVELSSVCPWARRLFVLDGGILIDQPGQYGFSGLTISRGVADPVKTMDIDRSGLPAGLTEVWFNNVLLQHNGDFGVYEQFGIFPANNVYVYAERLLINALNGCTTPAAKITDSYFFAGVNTNVNGVELGAGETGLEMSTWAIAALENSDVGGPVRFTGANAQLNTNYTNFFAASDVVANIGAGNLLNIRNGRVYCGPGGNAFTGTGVLQFTNMLHWNAWTWAGTLTVMTQDFEAGWVPNPADFVAPAPITIQQGMQRIVTAVVGLLGGAIP